MGNLIILSQLCILQMVSAYRMEVPMAQEEAYCNATKTHMTFKPTATCCGGKVIRPGIAVKDNWAACSEDAKGKSNELEDIGWNMYSCILQKSLTDGAEELSLQAFADLVSKDYPEDIKTKITEEIEKQSVANATFTDFEKLEAIRITYYDIEKAVCSGNIGDGITYGAKDEKCFAWKEEHHRSGMCCKKAYPVDLLYNSLMELNSEQSSYVSSNCKEQMQEKLKPFGNTETIEYNIMEICWFACKMFTQGSLNIETDIIMNINKTFSLKQELQNKKFLPYVLQDTPIEKEAIDYVSKNYVFANTMKAMKEYQFADVIDSKSNTERPEHFDAYVQLPFNKSERFKFDFMRRKFHDQIIHIPILCSAYQEIATLMEYSVYHKCHESKQVETE